MRKASPLPAYMIALFSILQHTSIPVNFLRWGDVGAFLKHLKALPRVPLERVSVPF